MLVYVHTQITCNTHARICTNIEFSGPRGYIADVVSNREACVRTYRILIRVISIADVDILLLRSDLLPVISFRVPTYPDMPPAYQRVPPEDPRATDEPVVILLIRPAQEERARVPNITPQTSPSTTIPGARP